MPRPLALDEEAMELVALAFEICRLSDALVEYDSIENRMHRALEHKGKSAEQLITVLMAGDEKERQMLAVLRARSVSIRSRSRELTARISGVTPSVEGVLPLFDERELASA